jgi:RNA polymerase sigma-70 factor (ECF subfamily)
VNNIPEHELIESAKTGDRTAFSQLIRLHADKIYNLCYRLTGSHGAADADAKDLLQEVFIHVLENIRSYKHKSSFSTWVHKLTINFWINKTKLNNRLKFVPFDEPVDDDDPVTLENKVADQAGMIEQTLVDKEQKQKTQSALDTLTADQKIVIILKYIEGKSLDEIAKICDCTINAVSCRLLRGVKELRKQLKQT